MCAPGSKHAQKRLRWFVVCVSLSLHILLRVVLPEYNYVLTGRIPDYALSKWQEQGPVDDGKRWDSDGRCILHAELL